MYDPADMSWTNLVSGSPPSPRYGQGLTASGGKLYMHGGYGSNVNTAGYGLCLFRLIW